MKTTTTTTAALLTALALAGCKDAPATSGTSAAPEPPVPGDPAHYAPDGWPLQIGDKLTEQRFNETRGDGFLGFHGLVAIHAVDGDVFSARFQRMDGRLPGSDQGPTRHWVYEGHFPGILATPTTDAARAELALPLEFRGKIEYMEAGPPLGEDYPIIDVWPLLPEEMRIWQPDRKTER